MVVTAVAVGARVVIGSRIWNGSATLRVALGSWSVSVVSSCFAGLVGTTNPTPLPAVLDAGNTVPPRSTWVPMPYALPVVCTAAMSPGRATSGTIRCRLASALRVA